jgi:signal transduction histidine kinase
MPGVYPFSGALGPKMGPWSHDNGTRVGDHARPVTAAARRAPFVLGALGVLGALAGLALLAPNHVTRRPQDWPYFVDDATQGLAFSLAGMWIARARPAHRLALLLCLIGGLHGLVAGLGQWSLLASRTRPGLGLEGVTGWLEASLYLPALAVLLTLVPLLTPDGRLPSRRWRPVAIAAGALAGAATLLALASPYSSGSVEPSANAYGAQLRAPLGLGAAQALLGVALGLTLLLALPCLASLLARARRARSEPERSQLRWVLAGLAVAVAGVLAGLAAPGAAGWLQTVTLPAFPAAIAVAVVRHRLFDLDVVLRRSLLFAVLTGAAVVVYLVVVGLASRLLDGIVPALLGSAAVAAVLGTVRDWAQRRVDRLVYGDRADPYAALRRLGMRLEQAAEPAAVLPGVVEAVTAALRAPRARIERDGRTLAEHGAPGAGGEPLAIALTAHGAAQGRLEVWPRTPGEPSSAADRRLLADLARQAGPAVRAVALAADLQHSRERLVLAREEERRRLRTDLHDGLGPTLTGIAMQLDAAGALLDSDPERAGALLARGAAEARGAIVDVRRVVDELRPAALDDLGLVGALGERARALEGLPVRLTVGPGLERLPAAVEVAAFRIAQEALNNAARHARARSCAVTLSQNGRLELEISDDGDGLPDVVRPGVGLRSMHERAEELGGSCEVSARPGGGTRVLARLPLREAP